MLLDPENQDDYIWADSTYSGERFKDLPSLAGFENRIHEKGSRNHPLNAAARKRNSIRSQIRARVEHVFGCFATSIEDEFTRKFGLKEIRLSCRRAFFYERLRRAETSFYAKCSFPLLW